METQNRAMRILIFMGGFFPGVKYGGPPVSIDNLSSLLDTYQFYIITTNHDLGEAQKYSTISDDWNFRKENLEVKYLSDKDYGYKSFESSLLSVKPDVVYLQGLFQRCVFPVLRLAKKYSIPVFLAPRGELCAGAFKKKYKKLPYIYVLRRTGLLRGVSFQSTSEEETLAITKYLKANPNRVFLLSNIPSVPAKSTTPPIAKSSGSIKIIFLSRIVAKKNLAFAIRSLDGLDGNIIFDIYGPIEDSDYWNVCQKEIKRLPRNISVTYKGVVPHDSIHKVLTTYHVFLFPTLSENYGHVIIESMLAGCIPIISDQTPWSDINDKNCGWALPLSNVTSFTNAIHQVEQMDDDSFSEMRSRLEEYLSGKLSLSETRKAYQTAFNNVVNHSLSGI